MSSRRSPVVGPLAAYADGFRQALAAAGYARADGRSLQPAADRVERLARRERCDAG